VIVASGRKPFKQLDSSAVAHSITNRKHVCRPYTDNALLNIGAHCIDRY